MAQVLPPQETTKLPGRYVKWLRVAEPRIKKEHLRMENYMVSIIEEADEITVMLQSLDAPPDVIGSGGTYPGYVVEIRKRDSRIIKSYFLR